MAGMHVEDLDTSFQYSAYTVSGKPLTLSPRLCGTPAAMLTRAILCWTFMVQRTLGSICGVPATLSLFLGSYVDDFVQFAYE